MQDSLLNSNYESFEHASIERVSLTFITTSTLSALIETECKNRFFIFNKDEITNGVFYRTWIHNATYYEAVIDTNTDTVKLYKYKFFPGTLFSDVHVVALKLRARYIKR